MYCFIFKTYGQDHNKNTNCKSKQVNRWVDDLVNFSN